MHYRVRKPTKPYILGIDEAGWGAWAGPFTIGGIVAPSLHPELKRLHKKGKVRDSKKMSDARRRSALSHIADTALFGKVVFCDVARIKRMSPKAAWRWGIAEVIRQIAQGLELAPEDLRSSLTIIVDGAVDKPTKAHYPWISFISKADAQYPVVSAASIYAKVLRDDHMIQLGQQYPEFGFHSHKGYGTREHRDALKRFGVTTEHRPIRSMAQITTMTYTRKSASLRT